MPAPERGSHGLIDRSEIVDVRLQEVHAVSHVAQPPEDIEAVITMGQPQYRIQDDRILIRFRHRVDFRFAGGDGLSVSETEQSNAGAGELEPGDEYPGAPDLAEIAFENSGSSDADTGEAIGEVRVAHVVELSYVGDQPSAEDIDAMVMRNLLFTVFPYVRAEVQRAAASVGLPPVVLGFMRRPLSP